MLMHKTRNKLWVQTSRSMIPLKHPDVLNSIAVLLTAMSFPG